MWGRHLRHSLETETIGPQSAGIKTATGLVTRIAIGIAIGNVTGLKRETSGMVQNGPTSALHDAKTTTVSAAVLTRVQTFACRHEGMLLTTAKQSRGAWGQCQSIARPQEVTQPRMSTSAASTHVTFNTFSCTS